MNLSQKLILFATAIIVALMTIFPPYEIVLSGQRLNSGYAFLFHLPSTVAGYEGYFSAKVDVQTLLVQIFATIVVCVLLLYATKKS